jgi:hypothetical protein
MPDASDISDMLSLPDAVEKAEALLDRVLHGIRGAAAGARHSAPAANAESAVDGAEPRPPMDRAADIVDTLGKRASDWYDTASTTVRRSAALAREEAEDILADAQALRHRSP